MNKLLNKLKKDEKGSVTLFVLATMLFFVTMLVLSYNSQINSITSQRKQIEQIEKQYSVTTEELEMAYERVIDN